MRNFEDTLRNFEKLCGYFELTLRNFEDTLRNVEDTFRNFEDTLRILLETLRILCKLRSSLHNFLTGPVRLILLVCLLTKATTGSGEGDVVKCISATMSLP